MKNPFLFHLALLCEICFFNIFIRRRREKEKYIKISNLAFHSLLRVLEGRTPGGIGIEWKRNSIITSAISGEKSETVKRKLWWWYPERISNKTTYTMSSYATSWIFMREERNKVHHGNDSSPEQYLLNSWQSFSRARWRKKTLSTRSSLSVNYWIHIHGWQQHLHVPSNASTSLTE